VESRTALAGRLASVTARSRNGCASSTRSHTVCSAAIVSQPSGTMRENLPADRNAPRPIPPWRRSRCDEHRTSGRSPLLLTQATVLRAVLDYVAREGPVRPRFVDCGVGRGRVLESRLDERQGRQPGGRPLARLLAERGRPEVGARGGFFTCAIGCLGDDLLHRGRTAFRGQASRCSSPVAPGALRVSETDPRLPNAPR